MFLTNTFLFCRKTNPEKPTDLEHSRLSLVSIGLAYPKPYKTTYLERSGQNLVCVETQTKSQIKSVPNKVWFALVCSVPKKRRQNHRSRVFPTMFGLHCFVLSQGNPDETTYLVMKNFTYEVEDQRLALH
uniref:Uncharacterized protein n=1 Tax=Timema tahoe TaxID=61484 RepID=A0A7R9IMM1_9NEOP|nr:unnamed protein product [Timema tahoe]